MHWAGVASRWLESARVEEGDERVQATYGPNYSKLARIKARYDPENLFRVNQNIQPEAA